MDFEISKSWQVQNLRRRIMSSSLVLASIFLCIHLIDPFESTLATTASYLLPSGIWAAYIIRRFLCVKYVRNVRVLEGGSLVVPALDPRKARIIQPSDILHTRLHHIGNQQILRIDISRSTPLFFRSEEFEHSGELEEIARLLTPRARAKPQIKQPLLTLFVSIGLILLSLIHWTCFDTGASQLIRLGALIREPLIVSEIYRLLTYSLIHLNLTHLLLNVALFLGCGYAIEHTMPAPKFAALLIASISVSASAFWWSDHMLLIGFSGAVWGCAGYFIALRCDPSHDQLERFPQLPTWTLILAIGAEMGLDALTQHTSLGVHALGFLVGCAFYVLSKKLSTNTLVHAGYALALIFLASTVYGGWRAATWGDRKTQDIARFWIDSSTEEQYLKIGAWMIATMDSPNEELLGIAISKLEAQTVRSGDKDTIALLHARAGRWARAISTLSEALEMDHDSRFASRIVAIYVASGEQVRLDTVNFPAQIDALCGDTFVRKAFNRRTELESFCPNQEIVLFEVKAPNRYQDLNIRLDPSTLDNTTRLLASAGPG